MTFEDYGIVSWYNGEFGVILTPSIIKSLFIQKIK